MANEYTARPIPGIQPGESPSAYAARLFAFLRPELQNIERAIEAGSVTSKTRIGLWQRSFLTMGA